MKTLVAIGIVVAGIAYAGDLDPPKGPVGPTMHTLDEIYNAVTNPPCCSPRPEDVRAYHMFIPTNETTIIIPKVEGTNGFVLTDVISAGSLQVFQNTGEGPVQILRIHVNKLLLRPPVC